ncbi:calcium uniporter protein 5, mitochondrial-like isoform X1 [Nicotiana tomentosiformis]|uniref:calcium uniporter protein 5, mitochondrial-like isoform X1 n=1 Tax=Nicotiana tomentosiformis TaxID=4098 RepID=UPI00051CA280|nr:calcium uniporter protein 5, mitochondrial-like isoform X1 [Nicotiana tomentosiformis]
MWKTSCYLLKRTVTSAARAKWQLDRSYQHGWFMGGYYFSSGGEKKNGINGGLISSQEEAKRLMNVEELKTRLGMESKEVIGYSELLRVLCENIGLAKTQGEAVAFARLLDEAGVIWLFRDKVYLHPNKVVDEIRRAVPLALLREDDPIKDELKNLQEKKDKIDEVAHKQVRRILWTGLGAGILQIGLFFRLTFWEFSWDVMEPITFFTTSSGLILGYFYFLITCRDPTYQDLLKRLFLARERKLIKKNNFDIQRFVELQRKCKLPLNGQASLKHRLGIQLEPEDLLHGH